MQYSTINYRYTVVEQGSGTYSSCIIETLWEVVIQCRPFLGNIRNEGTAPGQTSWL